MYGDDDNSSGFYSSSDSGVTSGPGDAYSFGGSNGYDKGPESTNNPFLTTSATNDGANGIRTYTGNIFADQANTEALLKFDADRYKPAPPVNEFWVPNTPTTQKTAPKTESGPKAYSSFNPVGTSPAQRQGPARHSQRPATRRPNAVLLRSSFEAPHRPQTLEERTANCFDVKDASAHADEHLREFRAEARRSLRRKVMFGLAASSVLLGKAFSDGFMKFSTFSPGLNDALIYGAGFAALLYTTVQIGRLSKTYSKWAAGAAALTAASVVLAGCFYTQHLYSKNQTAEGSQPYVVQEVPLTYEGRDLNAELLSSSLRKIEDDYRYDRGLFPVLFAKKPVLACQSLDMPDMKPVGCLHVIDTNTRLTRLAAIKSEGKILELVGLNKDQHLVISHDAAEESPFGPARGGWVKPLSYWQKIKMILDAH